MNLQQASLYSTSTKQQQQQERKVLTHIDGSKNLPKMVDVSEKQATARTARACATVTLPKDVMSQLLSSNNPEGVKEVETAKGPVFATAIVAGTMGAKRTHELIPFCHPLNIEKCQLDIKVVSETDIKVTCTVKVHNKTGVEMEALVGCSVAALTVYDMCKALSHDIVISDVRLVSKTGGKSDFVLPTSTSPSSKGDDDGSSN